MQQNSSLALRNHFNYEQLTKWLPWEFTIIERGLFPAIQNLQACLDIAIFHQRHKSKDNILADKNTTICLQ
jgi:hypothetical protein